MNKYLSIELCELGHCAPDMIKHAIDVVLKRFSLSAYMFNPLGIVKVYRNLNWRLFWRERLFIFEINLLVND